MTTDRRAEAPLDQRWQVEAYDTWGDRPGIMASLLRYRLWVVAVTVLAAVAGYAGSQLLPVRYDAEATVILRDPGIPGILGGATRSIPSVDLQTYVSKQADIMVSSVVLRRALGTVGSQRSLREARRRLEVRPSKDLASVTVRASDGDAAAATAMANAVGSAYQRVTAERVQQEAERAIASLEEARAQLQAELDASPKSPSGGLTPQQQALVSRIADLDQREQDVNTQAAVNSSPVELFERAERPASPAQPKPPLNALLGALLGLIGVGAWAWWAAARNQRAERRYDPAPILGAPLLGEVPPMRARRLLAGRSDQPVPEAYHFVVASLEHKLSSIGGSSVVVTSAMPSDAKTSTTLSIALAAQHQDRQVVLVDGDQRTRHLSELCGLSRPGTERNGDGVTPAHDAPAADEEYLQELIRSLVLTRGGVVLPIPPRGIELGHPSRFSRTPDFRKALVSIGQLFDLVLIDAPALPVSDVISIAGEADGVVLVVDHGVSLSQLREARNRLAFVSTPLIGYVFVRPRSPAARALPRLGRRSRRRAEALSRPPVKAGDS